MGRFEELVKGKPLVEFPDSYIVVDIETTGLDPVRDCIMEISAGELLGNKLPSFLHHPLLLNCYLKVNS